MQASYFGTDADSFVGSFDTRMSQFQQAITYISKKTETADPSDLILFAGDMNVNGDALNPEAKSYKDIVQDNPEFRDVLKHIDEEYEILMKILSQE
jgi:hypothetical protein